MKTFLIVGLGNIGREYAGTRHNVGFEVLDFFALKNKLVFQSSRYADMTIHSLKGRKIVLIKPSTYMNLSGKAVSYWLQKENIEPEKMLVVADDVALNLGSIRLRKKGGSGGHNGLQNIIDVLGNDNFSRLRIGIGNDYPRGMQSDYVLGKWFPEQVPIIIKAIESTDKIIEEFVLSGIDIAMNSFNKSEK